MCSSDLIAVIFFVVTYIARREGDSWLANGAAWFGKAVEGFAVTASAGVGINCPKGWKFFNDPRGGSFCCGATVNPYGASCSDPAEMCAFEPGVPDPRGGNRPPVPTCKTT